MAHRTSLWMVFLSLSSFIAIYAPLAEATAKEQLRAFFNDVSTYRARFEQVVLDDQLQLIDESSGQVLIKRPGKFRWDYDPPADRRIVSDGKRVWIHDLDLEQVTVRRLTETLGKSPAQIIAGDAQLEQDFTINDLGGQGSLDWVEVTPKSSSDNFEAMRLGFEGADLRVMEMIDGLGQTTRISLSHAQVNPHLDDNEFDFVVPEGADVIDQSQDRE